MTKGRRQQKTSHARRSMARLTFEWHFAQTPSPPKKTSRRPSCKTRRGQVRMPNARPIDRELSTSTASIQQHRLIKERLRCHHVQLKVVETTMGRKEQREQERKKAAKGSYGVERVRLFAKKAIVVRRCPERDGDESAAARGRGQLFAIVPPATRTKQREALCSRLQRLK